ncbi:MAG: glycine--tRNA ligase [Candidatus Nanoarchaeia archaeon]
MNKLDEINAIASKRGFFFQTANIYGGKAGFFTYGHLGKQLKSNWENLWRKYILGLDDNFHEIQSNNILPEEVFKASGHIEHFNDPLVECKKCKFRFRADQLLEDAGIEAEGMSLEELDKMIDKKKLVCPKCSGQLGEVKEFNMMFPVNIGFDNNKAYLSPETAQAAYLAFREEFKATREKLPLGLAIIDKAYRNEISPRQMFFRLREFSQAELQIFFNPDKIDEHNNWQEIKKEKLRLKPANQKQISEKTCQELNKHYPKFYLYHAAKIQDFYLNKIGIPKERFRFRELGEGERAFYNKIHFDIEVKLDTLNGFKEVAGLHYRGEHDLLGHAKQSKKKLEVVDGKRVLPHVLELSFGVDRNIWMLMDVFYGKGKEGSMFKFPPKLAPIQAGIFPLVRKDEQLVKLSKEIYNDLKEEFNVIYDESASVGKRYARQDEIGTPFCITIDGDSLQDGDVTIRDRDSTKQIRCSIDILKEEMRNLLNGKKFGKKV